MWALLRQSAVVIHGDEHLGNLYVTADGAPGVIGWFAGRTIGPSALRTSCCARSTSSIGATGAPAVVALRHSPRGAGRKDVPSFGTRGFCTAAQPSIDDDVAQQQRRLATGSDQCGERCTTATA
jgi:hypothetical protein